MAKDRNDFLIEDNGNYMVANGDFVVGDSRVQEAVLIISSNKGEFKHYPLIGCNVITWKNKNAYKDDVMREVKQQLEASGLNYRDFVMQLEGNG